jgi:excisionase family DNA binding protein
MSTQATDGLSSILDDLAARVVDRLRKEQPDKRLYTVVEAAGYLGMTRRALEGLVHRREIASVRTGARRRFDREDLDGWIKMRKGVE